MRILLIVPSFPPINAPDGHRSRQFLQYASDQNQYVVLTMRPDQVPFAKDNLLLNGISQDAQVIQVTPKPFNWPKFFRINNKIVQSISSFYQEIRRVHAEEKIDLIFVSATSYAISFAAYKAFKKFRIPYIIDMQDPWRSDHYLKVPKSQRPSKFWFSFTFDAILEWMVLPKAAGFITVNTKYVNDVLKRYKLSYRPALTLPFAVSKADFEIARRLPSLLPKENPEIIQIVYVGRVNFSMHQSFDFFFSLLKRMKDEGIYFHFSLIGTSYATPPDQESNLDYLIEKYQLSAFVSQQPNRIGYFQSIKYLLHADLIFIPSSSDQKYNPSKWANVLSSNTSIITELPFPEGIPDSKSFFHLNPKLGLAELVGHLKNFLRIDNLRNKSYRELPSSFFADEHAKKIELFFIKVILGEQED